MNKTKKMIILSLFVAKAIALYIFESYIPNPFLFLSPGAKLGISNIVTLICLELFGFKDTLIIVFLRILISSFWGSLSSFLFSITGSVLSLLIMNLLIKYKKENLSIIGVSMAGSIFHNIGQLLVASFIIKDINIFMYLPVLFISSIPTGMFVGVVCKLFIDKYKNMLKRFQVLSIDK
ncbi:heptaprenyl diphosphate synthase [Alkalithermobacter thermoalcaliphilus JW-YL-7 = DSM 7308]|uniref:Heptaprenyl diphosphate synthase n=1 Tax=Alkalithermobacter thermoalcaliphilus JW-YL-7 = DSM 7308 TaxID=1121328 RepID=A0A150FRV7_CLOPD|nr:Heptaprenyl diphosphate synthase component I [[Clostridium] paradoxum JW-YL-7 = DSM 7308]SHK38025.1 heptaprenyl diphosphate synthase [[Clostridium] paradoxum JW-YL-7 = DSM 7308]